VFGVLPTPRLVALAALAVLVPAGQAVPPVALLGLATSVVAAVATWDTRQNPAIPASASGELADGG
jgi:hypothetical protein